MKSKVVLLDLPADVPMDVLHGNIPKFGTVRKPTAHTIAVTAEIRHGLVQLTALFSNQLTHRWYSKL